MVIRSSLSVIVAWRGKSLYCPILLFLLSNISLSFFDTMSLVFSKPCSFHSTPNTPFDSPRHGDSASEEASVAWRFFNYVVARLVLKVWEEWELTGIGHWCFSLALFLL